VSPSSGDGQYLKGTQHGFCPQTQNTTGRRSVHLKGTQHRFWVLRIFAHKHGLRVPPQAALPNSKNRFSGFEPPKTTDRRPDVQVCFLIFCRRRLEAPTKKQKTDPDKKSKNRPQEMAVKTFPTSTRTNQNWLGGQQSTIRHDAATPISIIPMYCHHVRRCEC